MTRLMTIRTGRRGLSSLAALMLLAALGSAERRAGATYYNITDLGNLGGTPALGGSSAGGIINASGEVTGYSGGQAFLANNATMVGIGTLPGGGSSYGFGINDSGQIVGEAVSGAGNYDAFLYNSTTHTWTDLTTTNGIGSGSSSIVKAQANAINNSGQIVGMEINSSGAHNAFLYSGGTTTNLSTLANGGTGEANAINSTGQIAGEMVHSGQTQAFLDSGGTIKYLGTIGNSSGISYGYAVNASGEVVGQSDINNGSISHAYLYNGTTMTDLTAGAAYANYNSFAYDVNDSGAVVGNFSSSAFGGMHGFLYSGGVLTDLNSLISPTSGWTITGAYGINDNGQIAVIANNGSTTDALLLTAPLLVPEPPTIALLCSGAAVGLGLRRLSRRIKAEDLAAGSTAE